MSVLSRRPALSPLAEARSWVASQAREASAPASTAEPLAEDLRVADPVPAVMTARRAGWAVPAEATLGASPYGPVPLAGLRRILAGEALPEGADAVIPPDAASDAGRWFEVTATAAPGEGVVQPGAHLPAGQVLARAGERPPLLTRLLAAGDAAAMRALLAPLSRVVLGPVADPAFPGLAARPIEETLLGFDEARRPAAMLPDDPAACLLAWCALLAPSGERAEATLARKMPSQPGLADLVLVRLEEGRAIPLTAADQPSLAAFARATGWVEIPPESEGHPDGVGVTVHLFPPFLVA
ncbi:molybdopterin-binding domain-containing protein [Elioraea rosea]|uniref:hypothetical protein n=1 Tax=Elioraea rosea TaxID=2492390 RepID=UPI001183BDA6|nr:hypothetical protein [Elioraea rosea]